MSVLNWRLGIGLLASCCVIVAVVATQPPAQRTVAKQSTAPHTQPREPQRGDRRDPPPWWRDEKSKAELKLTADQVQRIEAIFQASFPKARTQWDELRRLEDLVNVRISANDATEAEVLRLADQMESVRSSMSKERILMLFRMRRVLSAEQRALLFEMQRRRQPGRQALGFR